MSRENGSLGLEAPPVLIEAANFTLETCLANSHFLAIHFQVLDSGSNFMARVPSLCPERISELRRPYSNKFKALDSRVQLHSYQTALTRIWQTWSKPQVAS